MTQCPSNAAGAGAPHLAEDDGAQVIHEALGAREERGQQAAALGQLQHQRVHGRPQQRVLGVLRRQGMKTYVRPLPCVRSGGWGQARQRSGRQARGVGGGASHGWARARAGRRGDRRCATGALLRTAALPPRHAGSSQLPHAARGALRPPPPPPTSMPSSSKSKCRMALRMPHSCLTRRTRSGPRPLLWTRRICGAAAERPPRCHGGPVPAHVRPSNPAAIACSTPDAPPTLCRPAQAADP
jgi:hypothetical protein